MLTETAYSLPGLGKYAISKSAPDVAEVVRNQADVETSRLVSTMGTVHYLAWAIPALGFLGLGPWYYDNGAVKVDLGGV